MKKSEADYIANVIADRFPKFANIAWSRNHATEI
jgi:hypothetical protein